MPSIIEGYSYDIFISYRQKDNRGERWVSEFVESLKAELESTFKEEISLYFDINPHDGLLETHDVDASLKQKLKCLIFVPIISRTYCDPKSFAWEHEFKAFVEQASQDRFGLKVTLPGGNVASRVLPVRIHELDEDDIKLCESVLGGFLRGVEFIYKETGVNRPLRSNEDNPGNNLNKTFYRNQVNKVANAVKELISGLKAEPEVPAKESLKQRETSEGVREVLKQPVNKKSGILNNRRLVSGVLVTAILVVAAILSYPKIFKRDTVKRLASSGEKITVAVMPFWNLTNDTTLNIMEDAIQTNLISAFSNTLELRVRQKETIDNLIQTKGFTENASISPAIAAQISQKLDADIYITGSIHKTGSGIRVEAQLIDTKTRDVFKSFKIEGTPEEENLLSIIDSLGKRITDFLLVSKLIKEDPTSVGNFRSSTNSPGALRDFSYAGKALRRYDLPNAIKWLEKAIAADSDYIAAMFELAAVYRQAGMIKKAEAVELKLYRKRDQMLLIDQLRTDYLYATRFKPIDVRINLLKELQEIDDQGNYHRLLAANYKALKQTENAIPEYEKSLDIWRKWGREFLEGNPDYASLGEAYHITGQYKKEKELYNEARMVNTNQRSVFFSWIIRDQASLALTEGDEAAAKRYIDELLSVLKENSFSESRVAEQLSLMYRNAGNLDKAEEYLRKALSSEPDSPQKLNSMAAFLIINNRKVEEALEIIDRALILKPDNANYLDTKGMGLFKLRKYSEALTLLEKARDLQKPFYSHEISSHIEEVKKAIAGKE